jgi:type I restriction enzyme S subunit
MSLNEAGVALIDCDHRTPPPVATGYPYIAIPQLKDGRIELADVRRISTADYEDWTRKLKPKEHDVIVVRRCSSGDSAVIPKGLKCAIGQNLVVLRADGRHVLPEFLRWLVRGPDWWEQIRKFMNVGAVFNSLKCKEIPNFEVMVPPIQHQREMVELLTGLDDKIVLLRSANATLEAIAQALFKSWFVSFDPVRAKADGCDPEGVTPEVADLFPSEFENSELGAIPKGWRVFTLGDHLDVVRGLSYKGSGLTNENDPEGVPMHNLNSVMEGGGYKYAGIKFYKGEYKSKHEIKAGDIIVANTEQGHRYLLIGFPAVIPVRVEKVGIFSHHLYRVRPAPSSPFGPLFILRLLMVPAVREQVIGCSNGTTVNMLKADGLAMPRFACPPRPLIEAYENIAAPIQARQEQNIVTAENLASIRDTLLPRLMTGKLRVDEVAV